MTDRSLRIGVRRISVSLVDGQPNGSRARCDPLDQELLHSNASCGRVFPHLVSRIHIAQQHSILKYDARSKQNARRSGENPASDCMAYRGNAVSYLGHPGSGATSSAPENLG
ncbi:hypothetical protein PF006_g28232 [Phytophthora fragariae]|uniref:Uncharacterized protein n=1 Tax=Phytophthora fragariae TaxID=53985 RepID=A0A6A3QH10_9STRA|nr:hypothetical protein PF006_g28232 [Phytophthora fragariae]KAE9171763.1 hypothetical protein PF004_g27461 [Phytophthora fragariae]